MILYHHDGNLLLDGGDECRHLLMIGATGTGKSRLVIIPSLIYTLRAKERRSIVVLDVKGELREKTYATAKANGYQIVDFNFRNPSLSHTRNPFARANRLFLEGQNQQARDMTWKLLEDIIANVFTDGNANIDPFWKFSSADLFRDICSGTFVPCCGI